MLATRVPPSLKAALERIAKQDRRSLASLVEKVLAEFVETSEQKPAKRK